MIGALNSLRILASQALGAASMALDPFRPDVDGRSRAADELAAAEAEAEVGDELAGPSSEVTYLDEIAHHLAAQTPLLEDIRNLLQHTVSPPKYPARYPFGGAAEGIAAERLSETSAAPGALPQPPAAVAEGPAPGRTDYVLPGAGHLTATPQCLRVAARGLRQWADGDVCTATSYWRSIAASLAAVAGAREAINDITQ